MRRMMLWIVSLSLLLLQVMPATAIEEVSSPTGYIVFTSMRDGNEEIYRYDLQRDVLTNLTNSPGSEGFPTFSPDGRYMAYVTDQFNYQGDIYLMDIRNGDTEQISQALFLEHRFPQWSSDGRYITWEVGSDSHDIYLYDVQAGRYVSNLTDHPRGDWAPAWSPDSTRITFQSWRSGVWNLYMMDIETLTVQNISQSIGSDQAAMWSPDGSQIVYISERDGNREIYMYGVDTGITQRLTHNEFIEWWPRWSPNGSMLAFTTNRDNPSGDYEVYVMNADGSNPRNLTNHPAWDELNGWSPDGEWIVFTSYRSGGGDIYILHVETGAVRQITDHPELDNDAIWIAGE